MKPKFIHVDGLRRSGYRYGAVIRTLDPRVYLIFSKDPIPKKRECMRCGKCRTFIFSGERFIKKEGRYFHEICVGGKI